MRIVIICGAGYISGKEKIMYSLLKGLEEQGDEVLCITSSWGNGQFESLLKSGQFAYEKMRLGFITKSFNLKAIRMTMEQMVYWPGLLYQYYRTIKKFRPDVVIHSNFHHLFLLLPAVSKRATINIYHSHESISDTKFYRWLFGRFQQKIRLFIGVSNYVTRKMTGLGIDERKTKTIHNGLEIIPWKQEITGTTGTFTFGIAGQVGSWKGHEDLVTALSIIRHNEPGLDFRLKIFGGGEPEFMATLKSLIQSLELDDFVEWKGFVKDIKGIYAGLQLVCVPSRSEEPFATSALEAGLFAVPVIVTRRGGFPEIVKDGHNGFIVEANDPGMLAEKITLLIKDPEKAALAGRNHQRVVTESFSFDNFIGNWKSTIASLLQ